ncbi:protein kinase [Bacillus sp. BGMRC 2118]|nr:protein kinase [Bacillus sp. BGMRC 2118]
MIKIGTLIDERYEILKEIGRGGMSIVYLAMDNRLNKSLVVKDIRKRKNSNDELLMNSLVLEANMLKKLDHGSLPKIYDIIDSDKGIYVVMDYIEGESLKEKLNREITISPREVIQWAKQLSDVLHYLHTRKPHPIIYRDMKPDNVMLTPEGKIKLIDFGIAREFKSENTTDTTNLGTKLYAAPEQISGKQTDARTDIYSLGVTLYHLITGKTIKDEPYELKPIRYWDPSFPEGLEHIISKSTQAEPGGRYQNCAELLYDLENIEKLTKGYKKQLLKKLSIFLLPATLFLAFTTTSVIGFNNIRDEETQDYQNLISTSNRYLMDGEEDKAIELLQNAIVEVEKRPEAYINLLDIYINKNETDAGLKLLNQYIEDNNGNIKKNSEIRFKMGMTYFDLVRDYQTALIHFREVDEEKIPDVEYYKSLATTLGTLNIDYKKFAEELGKFESYNDGLPNDRKKIDNYNALASIYLSYKSQISESNTSAIRVVEKALEVLNLQQQDDLKLKYEVNFEQKLAQAYYSRGVHFNSIDKVEAREDFAKAVEHYHSLLDMNVINTEEVMIKIGIIYSEMEKDLEAIEQLYSTIEKYPTSIEAHVQLGNLQVDIEQKKSEDTRNFSQALVIYNKAKEIENASNDEGFKKLTRRLMNLNILE